MNPTDDLAPMRALVVEHAMRLTDSDALVLAWLHVGPRSVQARVALGQLLADVPLSLDPETPIAVWTSPARPGMAALASDWRERLPERTRTLWTELACLEQAAPHHCLPPPCRCGPYARLAQARAAAERRSAARPPAA